MQLAVKSKVKQALRSSVKRGAAVASPPPFAQVEPTPPISMDLIIHPAFCTMSLVGDEVQTLTDRSGNNWVLAKGTKGPRLMTDDMGQKFLRFEGGLLASRLPCTLVLDTAFANGKTTRDFKGYFVGRMHRGGGGDGSIFSFGQPGSGLNTSAAHLNLGSRPSSASSSTNLYTSVTNAENMRIGTQMMVASVGPKATATGSYWARVNGVSSSSALGQSIASNAITNKGATIGMYAFGGNNTGGYFDLYYLAVKLSFVNDTDDAAMHTELMDKFYEQPGYKIGVPANDIWFEGDSITQNLSGNNPETSVPFMLTNPGASYALPARNRVINNAVSGTTTVQMKARMPGTGVAASLGGKAIYVFHGGRNDKDALFYTSAQSSASIQSCLYDGAAGGALERGWEVLLCINTQDSSYDAFIDGLRVLLRDEVTWDTAVLANAGNTYAGKINRVEFPLITQSAYPSFPRPFDTDAYATAAIGTYYGDTVHVTPLGRELLRDGGDTPQYGIRSAIMARLAA